MQEGGMSLKKCRRYGERFELTGADSKNYGSFGDQDRQIILQTTEDEDSDSFALREFSSISTTKQILFKDGKSKVDFVIVYETVSNNSSQSGLNDKKYSKHEQYRERFMATLRNAGLEMEEEIVSSSNRKLVYFIKIHAKWPTLCHYAEQLNMRAPLQLYPRPSMNWSADILHKIRLPNIMDQDVPNEPKHYYTCPFRNSKIDRFLGHENHESFFSDTQRSRIVYEILSTAVFGKKKKGEIGIGRLIEEGVFSSAFPLHDGSYEVKGNIHKDLMNRRQVLYQYWARWGCWYKYQPLDHIREYFGEKIAIYFAWLGFYTGWLLPAAIVGVLVFLYGIATMHSNKIAKEVCESHGSFLMCPLCDENIGCKYWDLSDICGYAKLAYLFDHPLTVFYAVFVSFWAVTFLEYWKRKSASLAHHWDCMGFQDEIERPRPEFAAKAPFQERNPVTGIQEPSFPKSQRHKRVAAGIGIIFIMIALVIIFIVAVIIYRVLVSIPLFQNATFRSQAQAIANMSGAVVNLFIIMGMSRVYENLAYRLTSWEMHRTQTEFDDNLTFKVFLFQFVNFYSSIFYIAFFKGRFVGYPGNYTLILRLRNEDCSAGGCLIELSQQLAVIMIGKQMINNAQEILLPKFKAWWHNRKVKLTKKKKRLRWEEDYQLVDNEGLFEEYLEMVLQFGFITIFVAAFPLAPLFALLNNWVEIRLDAQKFVCETRRTVAERAENIGIWFTILNMLAHLAVISNGFLIAFTSEFLPKIVYQYDYDWNLEGYINFTLAFSPNGTLKQRCRYRGLRDNEGNLTPFFWRLLAVQLSFVIVFEHVVFGICRLIDVMVPDIPESLELKIKRERFLAKQALQDSDTIMKVAAGIEDMEERERSRKMVLDLTAELGSDNDAQPQPGSSNISVVNRSEQTINENSQSPELNPPRKSYTMRVEATVMFRDGHKKIDYIIVYEETPKVQGSKKSTKADNREAFLSKLENLGLSLEKERVSVSEKTICFVKIFAEWSVLCHVAEYLSMRAPLMVKDDTPQTFLGKVFCHCFRNNAPNKPVQFYTTIFRAEKIDSFLGSDNQNTFFKETQRIRVVDEIVRTLIYGNKKKYEIGLDRLIKEKAISAGYPPHDGPYLADLKSDRSIWNKRQILYYYWARWKCFFTLQPTEHIREYFGEKVTLYFEWLGFYTVWLVPASLVGICSFMYGFIASKNNKIIQEACDSTSFLMCPGCDENSGCSYWELSSTCFYTYLSVFFDNHVTVIYCIFISIWAIIFLEFWKRKSASLAHEWNCLGYVSDVEMPMANFIVKAIDVEKNPVTGAWQPAFPKSISTFRVVIGFVLLYVMIIMMIILLIGVGIFCNLISKSLRHIGVNNSLIRMTSALTEHFLGIICILAAGKLYTWMAYHLTKWEMHRTQTQFDNHYIFKVFLFQCINYYSPLIYTGFFKGKFVGYPGNYLTVAGMRLEECSNGGCFVDLTIQFVVFVVGKQIITNGLEILTPVITKPWTKLQVRFSGNTWDQDFQLENHPKLYDEYFEMVMQYGFITIFSAAFPLIPAFALLNNLFQIRINAQKFLCYSRRPIPHWAESLGIWVHILQFLSYVAVVSNAVLIAFTSDFIPRLVYQYDNSGCLKGYVNFTLAYSPKGSLTKECRYQDFRDRNGFKTVFYWRILAMRFLFIIIFEHFVFGILYLTKRLIRDIPKKVELKMKREQFLGKLALQKTGAKVLNQTAMGNERESVPYET
ncbi:uncharacterized protein LOC106670115 isoform X2 [Cimex lectularius]|uniref:Anoctamin n=1 Tax=Cimex lectularius TaxID=79782 RepID=A0A8I6SR69_CIMLE|nr:uncharacterized protein LOC106670115 isoform X2 [Cimex lectularius]